MPDKRYPICKAHDLPAGNRRLVWLDGRSVGVFNIHGQYYALHNRCPHRGGALCEGPITGTTLPTRNYEFVYGRQGEIVRCGWHGWEFDIATAQCLSDPNYRARKYQVEVEDNEVVVYI